MTDPDLAHRDQIDPDLAAPTGRATVPADGPAAPGDSPVPTESRPAPSRPAPADGAQVLGEESERVARPGDADLATGNDTATGTDRAVEERTATGTDRAVEERTVIVTAARPRVSGAAVTGALLSAVGLCGALTGLLAPEAFVVAIIGGLLCLAGMASAARSQVAGGGLAVVGLIGAVAAVAIAVIAMTKQFSWPNSGVDEISRWHAWLVAHWSWLGRWT